MILWPLLHVAYGMDVQSLSRRRMQHTFCVHPPCGWCCATWPWVAATICELSATPGTAPPLQDYMFRGSSSVMSLGAADVTYMIPVVSAYGPYGWVLMVRLACFHHLTAQSNVSLCRISVQYYRIPYTVYPTYQSFVSLMSISSYIFWVHVADAAWGLKRGVPTWTAGSLGRSQHVGLHLCGRVEWLFQQCHATATLSRWRPREG